MSATLPNCPDEVTFIVLNGYEIASVNLLLQKCDSKISFSHYKTDILRLNLQMCESSLDEIIAELVDCLCNLSISTDLTSTLNQIIGQSPNLWTGHRIKQLLHSVLYSEVLSERIAWDGNHDYLKIFCYQSAENRLHYYSPYERGDLIGFVLNHTVVTLKVEKHNEEENTLSGILKFYIGKC